MARQVTVTTGARLHFGPLSYRPSSGRHFGGVGLMVDQPGVQLVFTEADSDDITGEPMVVDRVREFVACDRESRDNLVLPRCRIDVQKFVPFHAGLGSGTQLGLAVARGLAELRGESNVPVETLAARVARGRRSAAGLYGFAQGGLIVDAGKRDGDDIGALACRLPVPDEWRVLLITPPTAQGGLSGTQEEQAFAQLGSMPVELTNQLSRVVLTELLPAVTAADFAGFSRAVYEYGSRVGEFFSRAQGGVFGDPTTDKLVRDIRRLGVEGIGQTSWGPTLFAFVSDAGQAQSVAGQIRAAQAAGSMPLGVQIVSVRNHGATVEGSHRTSA